MPENCASRRNRGPEPTAHLWLVVVLIFALFTVACITVPGASGTFEKTLTVTGPVYLELRNGSGNTDIRAGGDGQVRIRGEFRVHAFFWESGHGIAEDVSKNPPIEQQGNIIRIGFEPGFRHRISVDYTIVVPPDTRIEAGTGSGNMEIRGIRNRAHLSAGSGNITADEIGGEVEANAGSGNVTLRDVQGDVQARVGSGDLTVVRARGEIRATTGSGDIELGVTGGRVEATAGSGDVCVTGAAQDVRVRTGSGDINIEGNPVARSLWDFRAGSGDITLDVPDNASFRLYAHSRSGRIVTDIELTVEQQSRRELRGRVGKGDARIEAETTSGTIRVH